MNLAGRYRTAAKEPSMTATLVSGLDQVVAATTRLSHVDGERGELLIAGYPVEELAPNASSEQVAYLLWHDDLPAPPVLVDLRAELARARELPPATLQLLRAAAQVAPMDALRMGVASLPLAPDAEPETSARRLVGSFPALVAAHWRFRHG